MCVLCLSACVRVFVCVCAFAEKSMSESTPCSYPLASLLPIRLKLGTVSLSGSGVWGLANCNVDRVCHQREANRLGAEKCTMLTMLTP